MNTNTSARCLLPFKYLPHHSRKHSDLQER
jgi:hypothetical protein